MTEQTDDKAIEVLRTPGEQLKYTFMEAYKEWTEAIGSIARAMTWDRYVVARDRYLSYQG